MKYTIGVDFGTESGRAVLVDVAAGEELATSVHTYANGVIDERLPESGVVLEPDWALQDPNDYLEVLKHAVPAVLRESGVDPADVIGLGIDFTACTVLPTTADGTPLAFLPEWRANPHAWVKLWKHHAAQPEADRINAVARARGEPWLPLYGGKISSEWFYSKALQMLNEAPAVYRAADRFIEAADWVIWQLTGQETRNVCTAGYKAIWQEDRGFPSREFFAALHPAMADIVDTKMRREVAPLGGKAGALTPEAAAWTGLRPGTAVAVANVDAHVTVPVTGSTAPGTMVMIMGTSTCHVVIGETLADVPGMCGVVQGGVVPGLFGYEAGQSAVGDIFAWFVEHGVPATYRDEAARRGVSLHALLEAEAAQLRPGRERAARPRLVERQPVHPGRRGPERPAVGMTLATTAPDIYRALIEATAYGTREIVEALARGGVPVTTLIAAGGLPERNRLLMQIYADVLGRDIRVVRSSQAGAVGAAMHAAVAAGPDAGGYADIHAAAARMGGLRDDVYTPIPAHSQVYDRLYAEYQTLYAYFGRGQNDVMKRLRALRRAALAPAARADDQAREQRRPARRYRAAGPRRRRSRQCLNA